MWEIILVLSIIQGITEFLPISSSAHLILIPKFFSQIETARNFDVSLHFGSLFAVLIYLRKDLFNILIGNLSKNRTEKEGYKLFINLIIQPSKNCSGDSPVYKSICCTYNTSHWRIAVT